MSQVGMRHLTQDYQGLAFGKGALTASTSPLWSPHGAYSYGGFYGEADGSEAEAAASDKPAEEKGMLAKMMENKTMILGYSIPTALLIAGGLWWCCLRKNAPMPLKNPWMNFGGLGSEVAQMRWGDTKKKAAARKKLIARAKKLGQVKDAKEWNARRSSKKYSYPKRSKKAYTTKKDKNGRTMYYIDGKRVSKEKALGKAAGKVANPRRRKNALKVTNPRRRRNQSSYQKFMGKQMRAGKTMKQAARMWRSRK